MATTKAEGVSVSKKILSLDGGGIKGISSLLILQKIMERVVEVENRDQHTQRLPFDYFDLAAGTSTGGLIALMLFRLKMSTTATIMEFERLSQEIFSPRFLGFDLNRFGKLGYWFGSCWMIIKMLLLPAQFSARPLERAIDEVVGTHGMEDGDQELRGQAPLRKGAGKMFMCATLAYRGESILLRSYTPPADSFPATDLPAAANQDITIVNAARATSAAPTYLPELRIGPVAYWDGGLLNNNPINQAWDSRFDLATGITETPIVRCILSIGTSHCDAQPSSWLRAFNTISQVVSYVTNTEAKHLDFECNVRKLNNRQADPERKTEYFRFNVPTDEYIDLDDWQSMGRLRDYTTAYLRQSDVQAKIKRCAELLAH